MGKVLLVNPHVGFTLQDYQDRPRIPSAILLVGTALHHAGRKVALIDQLVERDWQARVDAELAGGDVDWVGITTMTGSQILNGLQVAEHVRRRVDAPIVWGGIHPTLLPEQTLGNELVDVVVRGEGEVTAVELDQALAGSRSLNTVEGVSYRDNGSVRHNPDRGFVDMDAQPLPHYDLLDMSIYTRPIDGVRSVNLATSRGCPYNCGYCYVNSYHRRKWRAVSAERAAEWIRQLVATYGYNRVWLDDEEFFIDLDRATRLMQELVPLGIRWKASIRIDTLLRAGDSFMELLVRSGCYRLTLGVESGSNRLLELMHKRVTRDDAIEANRLLARHEVYPRYNFMMGFPSEKLEDLSDTVELALQMKRENTRALFSNFFIFTPYPGCELHDLAIQQGLRPPGKLEDWARYRGNVDNAAWLNEEMRGALRLLAFATPFLNEPMDTTPPLLVKLLGRAYRPIARQRIRRRFYRFPVEIGLAKALGLYVNE